MKTQMTALSEDGLQQAGARNAGPAANARVDHGFFFLQMAIKHVQRPEQSLPNLNREWLAAGIGNDIRFMAALAEQPGAVLHLQGLSCI